MRIINIDEASELTRLSRATLYKYKLTGQIPFVKIGRRLLFDADRLETWCLSHCHEPKKEVKK